MSDAPFFNFSERSYDAQRAIYEEFIASIRTALRERAMAAVQQDIDAAIDQAVSDLRPVIQSYVRADTNRSVIEIIVRREPKP